MSNTIFYKQTNIYKEYYLLDLISRNEKITQRELAKELNVSVSMANTYLNKAYQEEYLSKHKYSYIVVRYKITEKGIERKRFLNIGYLNQALTIYDDARREVNSFLFDLKSKRYENLLFYGAGEVCEILLRTIDETKEKTVNVLAVIDDNITKQGNKYYNTLIGSTELINSVKHDAIIITSYTNREKIRDKLLELNYPADKILNFFK